MYEGLGIRFKKERKKLSRKAIVIIAVAGALVLSALGYVVFWNTKISAPFDKFYGEDYGLGLFMTRKSPTGYVVNVVKPYILDIGESVGYVSIEKIDRKFSLWFNLDALTNEVVDWAVGIELEPKSTEEDYMNYMRRVMGLKLDRSWKSYPEYSGLKEGKTQPYADKYRAEIQELFDEVYRRWGYKFPTESVEPYDYLVQQEW
ncbi:MAG: hypothetical protein LBK23_06760 [Oscillospiraceae bacterium]|jgi:hypothetical protein|nr:hypothetical protein [Oscillospiraceae bacterium]